MVGGRVEMPRVVSAFRLKVLLTTFVMALVLALSGTVFLLVDRIFTRLTPSIESDLRWKAEHGGRELAQTAELGIAVGDSKVIGEAMAEFIRGNDDLLAVVAVGAKSEVLFVHGAPPEKPLELFRGMP